MAINLKLERLYLEDKADRENEIALEALAQNDAERLHMLKELIKNEKIDFNEIWNLHYAALILQHSNNIEDFVLTHYYAKKAVNMGSKVTKWLYAATLDRLLIAQGKKQKLGTQYKLVGGKKVYPKTDGTISEEERREYGVIN